RAVTAFGKTRSVLFAAGRRSPEITAGARQLRPELVGHQVALDVVVGHLAAAGGPPEVAAGSRQLRPETFAGGHVVALDVRIGRQELAGSAIHREPVADVLLFARQALDLVHGCDPFRRCPDALRSEARSSFRTIATDAAPVHAG